MKRFIKSAKKGFTLVELIIVLVIMGIIAAAGVPSIVNYMSHTAERSCSRLMKNTMSSIRAAAVSRKHESCAAVSVQVYKALDNLPLVRLAYPKNVQSANESELEALEQGRPASNPLKILLSPEKAAATDEVYTVSWEFTSASESEAYMQVKISCNKHGEISLSDNIPLSFGAGFSDAQLPPKNNSEKQAVFSACEYFLGLKGWAPSKNGNKLQLTLSADGKNHTYYINNGGVVTVKGDKEAFAALAKLLSEQSGLDIETVEHMTVYITDEGCSVKSITFRIKGESGTTTFNW